MLKVREEPKRRETMGDRDRRRRKEQGKKEERARDERVPLVYVFTSTILAYTSD